MNFFETVYKIVSEIPTGKVISYGGVARLAGNPRMARQVGWALHVNPYQGVVPCHRVVMKDGSLSKGFPSAERKYSAHCSKKRAWGL